MEEHTLASIYELLDVVAASVRELAASVGELAASVGEVVASVGEVAASVGELAASLGELRDETNERFDRLEANQKTLIETVNGILGTLENHEERIERLEARI